MMKHIKNNTESTCKQKNRNNVVWNVIKLTAAGTGAGSFSGRFSTSVTYAFPKSEERGRSVCRTDDRGRRPLNGE